MKQTTQMRQDDDGFFRPVVKGWGRVHYYTTDLSSITQNTFSLGDFGDRD
jgi:hypothetical protein